MFVFVHLCSWVRAFVRVVVCLCARGFVLLCEGVVPLCAWLCICARVCSSVFVLCLCDRGCVHLRAWLCASVRVVVCLCCRVLASVRPSVPLL